jgi:uncharacterized protein (DUF952 family)
LSDDDVLFHLVAGAYYRDCDSTAPYTPESFADEGFIHCTDGLDNVTAVGNRYYKDDRRMYVVLVIERSKVAADIKYEDPDGIYPHIYGPLNRDAISDILPVMREQDGSFVKPHLRLH